jgi:hypothetical protein
MIGVLANQSRLNGTRKGIFLRSPQNQIKTIYTAGGIGMIRRQFWGIILFIFWAGVKNASF